MTRLSAEDEVRLAHLSVNLSAVGTAILVISLPLVGYVLSNFGGALDSWEGNNDTTTAFLIANLERLRNGSYYYSYTDPQNGVVDAYIIDSWFDNLIEGKYRYDYGTTFDNFCWKRNNIPAAESMASLFRSTQLFVGVQLLHSRFTFGPMLIANDTTDFSK